MLGNSFIVTGNFDANNKLRGSSFNNSRGTTLDSEEVKLTEKKPIRIGGPSNTFLDLG